MRRRINTCILYHGINTCFHLNSCGLHLKKNCEKFLPDNEGTLSTDPVLNNTANETVTQVCNNLNENMADSPFYKANNYKLENQKHITVTHLININSLIRNKFASIEELIKFK